MWAGYALHICLCEGKGGKEEKDASFPPSQNVWAGMPYTFVWVKEKGEKRKRMLLSPRLKRNALNNESVTIQIPPPPEIYIKMEEFFNRACNSPYINHAALGVRKMYEYTSILYTYGWRVQLVPAKTHPMAYKTFLTNRPFTKHSHIRNIPHKTSLSKIFPFTERPFNKHFHL